MNSWQNEYDPLYKIRYAADKLEQIKEDISELRHKIKEIPAIIKHKQDIAGLRKEKRRLLKSNKNSCSDPVDVSKIDESVKQLQKAIKYNEDGQQFNKKLKILLNHRKMYEFTIKGHEDFLEKCKKHDKEKRERVEELRKQFKNLMLELKALGRRGIRPM